MDPRLVNKYATILRNGGELPPITVAKIGAAYWLVDGFHRLAAEEKQHRRSWKTRGATMTTRATVVSGLTLRRALRMAALANLSHGAPLKTADLRKVFRTYVDTGMQRTKKGCKSYRVMAVELGAQRSYETIRGWMKQDYPGIARQMSGDDYSTHKPREKQRREDWTDDVMRHLGNVQAHCKGNQEDQLGIERVQSALDELSASLQSSREWRATRPEDYRSPEF